VDRQGRKNSYIELYVVDKEIVGTQQGWSGEWTRDLVDEDYYPREDEITCTPVTFDPKVMMQQRKQPRQQQQNP